jgi:hypothetical protein
MSNHDDINKYFFERSEEMRRLERMRSREAPIGAVNVVKNELALAEALIECARIRGKWCEELDSALELIRRLGRY